RRGILPRTLFRLPNGRSPTMANQLKMVMVETVLRLLQRGWSYRRIAREMGIHRDSVARLARKAKAAKAPLGAEQGGDESKPAKAPLGAGPVAEALSKLETLDKANPVLQAISPRSHGSIKTTRFGIQSLRQPLLWAQALFTLQPAFHKKSFRKKKLSWSV